MHSSDSVIVVGMALCLEMLCNVLSAEWLNFSLFSLYGDTALDVALQASLKLARPSLCVCDPWLSQWPIGTGLVGCVPARRLLDLLSNSCGSHLPPTVC